MFFFFFFSSRRRHTRFSRDWSSDVCSSDLTGRCRRRWTRGRPRWSPRGSCRCRRPSPRPCNRSDRPACPPSSSPGRPKSPLWALSYALLPASDSPWVITPEAGPKQAGAGPAPPAVARALRPLVGGATVRVQVGGGEQPPDVLRRGRKPAGGKDERAGVSHFIEHLLFKGSSRYTAQQIAETFDGLGGELNAATSREHTFVYARVTDAHLETAVDVMTDMV